MSDRAFNEARRHYEALKRCAESGGSKADAKEHYFSFMEWYPKASSENHFVLSIMAGEANKIMDQWGKNPGGGEAPPTNKTPDKPKPDGDVDTDGDIVS